MQNLSTTEFYSALQSNEYGKQYLELVAKIKSENKQWTRGSGLERHHIHPRALGGNVKDINNAIVCSISEHIQAHYYLALSFFGEHSSMLYAFNMLVSRAFSTLSELEQISLQDLEEWSTVRAAAAHRPHTEEEKHKISAGQVGRPKKKLTEEQRKAISERQKGRPAWNKGIHLRDLGKSYHLSEEGLNNIRKAAYGRRGCYIKVNNGIVAIAIRPEQLQEYLDQGYIKGALSTVQKGSIHIHRGDERKMVSADTLEQYLQDGWVRGRGISAPNKGIPHSLETRQKISAKQRGSIAISKDGIVKHIKPSELISYLNEGWEQGNVINYKRFHTQHVIHIHREGERKMIPESEWPNYEIQGWSKGRGKLHKG